MEKRSRAKLTLIKGHRNIELVKGKSGQDVQKPAGTWWNSRIDIVKEYGAGQPAAVYEMFMGPLEAVKPWNTKSVEGVYRFLTRAWRLIVADGEEFQAGHRRPFRT